MDLLNKAFARLGDWYRTSTPGIRVAVALLLIACAASAAFLFNQQTAWNETYLFGGEAVPASQWPAVMQAFASAGLTDYEMEGNRIRVPKGKQAAYMGALANAGALPNNFGDSLRKMLDKSSSPWIGKRQQEEMSKIALQDELTKIINSMPGIESASVLFNVQIEQGLTPKKQITASVNVKPSGSQLLSGRQVDMIRQVVGPPIGIDPQGVTIIDFNGATYPAATPGAGNDLNTDRVAKTKNEYEQKYAEKIREALSFVPGALVTVNVDLRSESAAAAETPAASRSNESGQEIAEQNESAGGVNEPAIIKTLVDSVVGPARPKHETTNRSMREAVNDFHQKAAIELVPKRVTVSIAVPSSYYEDVWRQRHSAMPDKNFARPDSEALRQIEIETSAMIRQHIQQVVPWPEDSSQDRAGLVSVTTFQHTTVETEHRAASDGARDWFTQHETTLGIGGIALASLLAVRWIVRSAPRTSEATSPLRLAEGTSEEFAETNSREGEFAERYRRVDGPSLRDELAGIVHDDPDGAASVLRNWIGSSS